MHKFFNSPFYDFELTRLLGSTAAGGCDAAEFVEAVGKIRRHDPESWRRAWEEQSVRAESVAREAARIGHGEAAGRAFLRASNYARAAGYMVPWTEGVRDSRVLALSKRAVALFRDVAERIMRLKIVEVECPGEEGRGAVVTEGYLFLPDEAKIRADDDSGIPVLINCAGADGTKEELYYAFAKQGTDLGYAVFTFEAPGQGTMLHQHRTALRPGFEVVSSLVLDRLARLAAAHYELGLDMGRVAVAGASLGGLFALRAAAAEPERIKACVAVDPFYGLYRLARTRMPGWFASLWERGYLPDAVLDACVGLVTSTDYTARWEFALGMAMTGASSPSATLRRFMLFDLDEGQALAKVKCPVFLTGASTSMYGSNDIGAPAICKGLVGVVDQGRKELWLPEEVGNGGLTGKVGAWALLGMKSFHFLDRWLGVARATEDRSTDSSAAHNSIMSSKLSNQPSKYGPLEDSIKQV